MNNINNDSKKDIECSYGLKTKSIENDDCEGNNIRKTSDSGSNTEPVGLKITRKMEPRLTVNRESVFKLIQQLCSQAIEQFSSSSSGQYNKRFTASCQEISEYSTVAYNLLIKMNSMALKFDFDENTPGNGFRSMICVCDTVVLHIISLLRSCCLMKNNLMFRISFFCKEIENYMAVLRFWILSSQQLIGSISYDDSDSLFPDIDVEDYDQYFNVLKTLETLDSTCFYSRPLGFQFCPSVGKMFKIIGILLATYSLAWEKGNGAFGSLIKSAKFLLSPEERASRIIKITREADVEFCKGFWNLPELGALPAIPKWFGITLALCEVREIKSCGPLPLETNDGGRVLIPEPTAHTGFRPVKIRVLSAVHRYHLSTVSQVPKIALSPYLIVHCHGGGYVATSSKSHEGYLRAWAKQSNCPVVSIDYSLAPENPYPRPTEEVLYAYAYMINYPEKFGWSGEKICLVGDSAGGNLITSVSIRMVNLNVKRLPDCIVPIYTPFLFQYVPSPSRILSFMDPILHMGILLRCLTAYTMGDVELNKLPLNNKHSETGDMDKKEEVPQGNGHRSLLEYVDELKNSQIGNIFKFDNLSDSIVAYYNCSNTNSGDSIVTNLSNNDGNCSSDKIPIISSEDNNATQNFLEEEIEGTPFNKTQNVQIFKDPDNILLSSENYDAGLIEFFKNNDLGNGKDKKSNLQTQKKSLTKSATTNFISSLFSTSQIGSPTEEKNKDVTNNEFMNTKNTSQNNIDTNLSVNIKLTTSSVSDNNIVELSNNNATSKLSESSDGNGYQKKKTLSQSLAQTASMAATYAIDNLTEWFETEKKPIGYGDKQKLSRAATMTPKMAAEHQQKETEFHKSTLDELLKLKIPRSAEISPLYADDETLRRLPPIYLIGCHLDPLLDDTVSFGRKVKKAGGQIKLVKLLDNLSHGFLNFTMVSPECKRGSDTCLEIMMEALGVPETFYKN
uniref:Hormone-sensitive lipase n=1 Tax=Parastrongyloides trichosuri TaxID=131310 RepID=A0A0N4ZII1_PARTI